MAQQQQQQAAGASIGGARRIDTPRETREAVAVAGTTVGSAGMSGTGGTGTAGTMVAGAPLSSHAPDEQPRQQGQALHHSHTLPPTHWHGKVD